jgi:hypothetical protein
MYALCYNALSSKYMPAMEEGKSVPDHELIITTAVDMIRIRSREHVIRNVASHAVHIILPLERRRHALHLADNAALVQDLARVRIALDIILAASPRPLRAPFDAGASGAVVVCALRAGGCGALAPQVVEDLVAGGRVVGVLRAEGDLFLDLADLADGGCAGFCKDVLVRKLVSGLRI